MRQLPLGVRIPDRALFESYLPGANLQAVEHLRHGASGATWLCGPSGVGKTHLLQATCVQASAMSRGGYFPLTEFERRGPAALEGLPQLDCLACDDLDRVVGKADWERALFAVWREMEERTAPLLVSAAAPPALLKWALPDLGSRFAAATVFQLRPLDEEQQRKALQLRAHVRGFELPDETARWLQRRFPRDMRTLYALLDTLDEAALVAQRRLTVPFIRSVLRDPPSNEGGG